MEYNNDNRTPLDRLTDDFLTELLDCDCDDRERGTTVRRLDRNRTFDRSTENRDYYRPANSESVIEDENCSCEADSTCGCGACVGFTSPALHGVPLAMVYSPHQHWENLYEAEVGFGRGTIFKCLDFPFMRSGCGCRNNNHSRG